MKKGFGRAKAYGETERKLTEKLNGSLLKD